MTKNTDWTFPSMISELAEEFLMAFHQGRVCLHPTDTIIGVAYNPLDEEAYKQVLRFKKRQILKPFLSLVNSLEKAKHFWQPLPKNWQRALEKLWPNPFTIIWYANDQAPRSLVNQENKIGFRVPKLQNDLMWFQEVLTTLAVPLPSTSVNVSGNNSITDWLEAVKAASQINDIFIPKGHYHSYGYGSTVVEVLDSGDFRVLREGDFSTEKMYEFL